MTSTIMSVMRLAEAGWQWQHVGVEDRMFSVVAFFEFFGFASPGVSWALGESCGMNIL